MNMWIARKNLINFIMYYPGKKAFYSELNLEDITDKDYEHAQKVWNMFEIKNLGKYHDLYVQSDTLLLAGLFENFRDKCIEIYELDPAHFLPAPGLAWQACLKKIRVNLELLTDIDMLLVVEKGIRGRTCQAMHRYATVNNKFMNNYDKSIESSYLMYLDANNLYGWAMSQKLPINGFKCDENSDKGYFPEVSVEYLENLFSSFEDLPFLPERIKIGKVEKLICSIEDKDVLYTRGLKQALNHGLKLKKIPRAIQFNERAWLKP